MESDVIFIFFRIFTPLSALVRITEAVDDDVAAFAAF
jgi:hypothetical protein